MDNKLIQCYFHECNLQDIFFDSLKKDYDGFQKWFIKKSKLKEKAHVYKENNLIKAFLYLKYNEIESIILRGQTLPAEPRIKIGTLKLSDCIQRQRIGEGIIGYCLWQWQKSSVNQIYITVFDKHSSLIKLLERFGFEKAGQNESGENVYIKDKRTINSFKPYASFPYIPRRDIGYAGLIPINDKYHDTLFRYSELANTDQECQEIAAANGITKVYIGTPSNKVNYKCGQMVFIYRRHTGDKYKGFKSVITSYCTVVSQRDICINGRYEVTMDKFLRLVGNKSVYNKEELAKIYYHNNTNNIVLLTMLYNGFFGKGNNVNWNWLNENNLFRAHPYNIKYDFNQVTKILKAGGRNVQDIIVNKS